MVDQRGGRRFAVGAGDGDERAASRRDSARSRQNSSMSPMTSTPRLARQLDRPMRLRDGSAARRAPAPAPRIFDQSSSRRSCVVMPGRLRLRRAVWHRRPRRRRRRRRRSSARAPAGPSCRGRRRATVLSAKRVTGIMSYLSFSVTSPTSASTTATIQKRITICGSVQPSCSK